MTAKTLDQRIVKTPGVCGGKPRIDGHRITVQNIAIWHDRLGWSADEIASEYDLEFADIYAALAYYFAHREEIDQAIEEGEAFVREMRRQTPSHRLFSRITCDLPQDNRCRSWARGSAPLLDRR